MLFSWQLQDIEILERAKGDTIVEKLRKLNSLIIEILNFYVLEEKVFANKISFTIFKRHHEKGEVHKQEKADTHKQEKGDTHKQEKGEVHKQEKAEVHKQEKGDTHKHEKEEIHKN